eukprot:c11936_g1_i1 orf=86-259(+)
MRACSLSYGSLCQKDVLENAIIPLPLRPNLQTYATTAARPHRKCRFSSSTPSARRAS